MFSNSKWVSRKLVAVLFGTILIPILQHTGTPEKTTDWLMGLIGVYIGGQSLVDAAGARKSGTQPAPHAD